MLPHDRREDEEEESMIANYHTHTFRCGHAEGSDEDYVRQAVRSGLQILGFSDHTPYVYFDAEPRSRPIRMTPEELPDYARSVRALAEQYRDRIEIRLGVEAEYYPKYFLRLLELLRENGVEYMILGQHFLGNEIGEAYSGRPTLDRKLLERYVSQTIEAMETGLFSYFAHPDLLRYIGSGKTYGQEMRRLCRAALQADVPLEINLLGLRERRHYPNERFWRIAAEEGNPVILGCDAHGPEQLADTDSEKTARALAERLGLTVLDTLPLRSIQR